MVRRDRKATGEISRRLEYVRTQFTSASYSLADFHRLLGGKEFVSYQTVQNYHFDRDPSVQYLAAVAATFSIDMGWLATGQGKATPWGTPGVEGEIDAGTRLALHHLTDPEEVEEAEAHKARIAESSFLGPLMESMLEQVVDAFTGALDEARTQDAMAPKTIADWKARELKVILALDHVLSETWAGAVDLLRQERVIEPSQLTVDQQIRFAHGMILAILALLPERGLPALAPIP